MRNDTYTQGANSASGSAEAVIVHDTETATVQSAPQPTDVSAANEPQSTTSEALTKIRQTPKTVDQPELRPKKNTRTPQTRSKGAISPPRKRSRYSALSSEVDKALSVMYAELETASASCKVEQDLQSKVQTLEQKLKVQDGQLLITRRELAWMRNQNADARPGINLLKVENVWLTEEIRKYKVMMQKKDDELNDWRARLRTMLGND